MKAPRPSPGLVIAVVALIVALGGSAVASSLINGKRIKNGTISASKLTKAARAQLKGSVGPPGPAGPAGARGLTGAAGPPGPTGITAVTVRTASVVVPNGSTGGTVAHCNAGERALGGGAFFPETSGGTDIFETAPAVGSSEAVAGQTPDGWKAEARNGSGASDVTLTVYAVCASP
jgi:hypothetical protein